MSLQSVVTPARRDDGECAAALSSAKTQLGWGGMGLPRVWNGNFVLVELAEAQLVLPRSWTVTHLLCCFAVFVFPLPELAPWKGRSVAPVQGRCREPALGQVNVFSVAGKSF